MTNLEIEVQDKNQLTLFSLLSREQEIEKAAVIKSYADTVKRSKAIAETKRDFLLANKFKEGIDFTADITVKVIDRVFNVGTYKEPVEVEVQIEIPEGDVYLYYNRYNSYDHKISLQKSQVTISKGKMNCYGLQGYSSRMIKPETMLAKIEEANTAAERDLERANKDRSVLGYTIGKYQDLFPRAMITKSTDGVSYGGKYQSFDVVNIKFENGSRLTLRLGYEKDKEYIYKKVDVVADKQTILGTLNIFDLQNRP